MTKPSASEQKQVVIGILVGWVLSAAYIIPLVLWGMPKGRMLTLSDEALGFSLGLAVLPLVLSIGWAAQTRHFSQNIDGEEPSAGSPLAMTQRIIQNTLEQTVLFIAAAISAHHGFGIQSAILLPVMATWFCIARLLFWIGYKSNNPLRRAIGFASTFHPTLALLLISTIMNISALV